MRSGLPSDIVTVSAENPTSNKPSRTSWRLKGSSDAYSSGFCRMRAARAPSQPVARTVTRQDNNHAARGVFISTGVGASTAESAAAGEANWEWRGVRPDADAVLQL